jgi:hypothetical protein
MNQKKLISTNFLFIREDPINVYMHIPFVQFYAQVRIILSFQFFEKKSFLFRRKFFFVFQKSLLV